MQGMLQKIFLIKECMISFGIVDARLDFGLNVEIATVIMVTFWNTVVAKGYIVQIQDWNP